MADGSWMRILGGQRSRLPTRPNSPNLDFPSTLQPPGSSHTTHLDSTEAQHGPHCKTISRLPSWYGLNRGASSTCDTSTGDVKAGDDRREPRVKETERVWHNPSVDQMAEALQTALMTRSTIEALPREYNAFILHLIEGYGAAKMTISETRKQLSEAETQQEKEREELATCKQGWNSLEAQYKAEIKRLELLIHRTSHNGLQAVVMARAGSLLNKGGRARTRGRGGAHNVDLSGEPAAGGAGHSSRLDGDMAISGSEQAIRHRDSILMRPRILDPDYDVERSERIRGKSSASRSSASHSRRHRSPARNTAAELSMHSLSSSSSSSEEPSSSLDRDSRSNVTHGPPLAHARFLPAPENKSLDPSPVIVVGSHPPQAQHKRDFSFAAGDDGLSMGRGGASGAHKARDAGREISRPPATRQRTKEFDDGRLTRLAGTHEDATCSASTITSNNSKSNGDSNADDRDSNADDRDSNANDRNRNNSTGNIQHRHQPHRQQAGESRTHLAMPQQRTEAKIAAVLASAAVSSGEGSATDAMAS